MYRRTAGTYWVWEMPEVAKKIPELFEEAGEARIIKFGASSHMVTVEVTLREPAKVVDWDLRNKGLDGLAINSSTSAILNAIQNGPSVLVQDLPRNGDKKVVFSLWLELHTFHKEAIVTTDDLENELKRMAAQMNKTWHYDFK